MSKQTKNIITREFIEKELRFYNTADIKSTLVLSIAFSLLFLPLTAVVLYVFSSLFKNILLKIVVSLVVGGTISAPIWLNLFSLITSLKERKLLRNGDYDITVREVQYKGETRVCRHIAKFLHFIGFKDVLVGTVDFELSSQGDEFYIVHYKDHTTVKLLYSVKLYEFKER